jgi:SAM-dependent methyltransferase
VTETSRLADPAYLRFQYADDQKLRVRIETHARYSENPQPFVEWVLTQLDARPGDRVLDVGSGPGQYHDRLRAQRVVALDSSAGMLAKVGVPAVRADAQWLPFHSRSFERVMANHVLYHLPDIPRALREIRRVVRAGGRVVIATNSRSTMRPLFALTDAAAAETGVEGGQTVGLRFGLEDTELVREAFPDARVAVYEDAFRFSSPEPVLAYVASMWIDHIDPGRRAAFLASLETRVREVIEREGLLRIPKRSGCFIADVAD